jgi:hypothetical protein
MPPTRRRAFLNQRRRVPISADVLPSADTLVEMAISDDTLCGVPVARAGDGSITLSLAMAEPPRPGAPVTLRWSAGPRGRYALSCEVTAADENRVELSPTGEPDIEQHRNFVRGGGGEPLLLLRPGQADASGSIRDISEQAVRAHFTDVELVCGEAVRLRIQLDADVVAVAATTIKVAALRQRLPLSGPMSVEVVAVFQADEAQARTIRRYVLRQQMLARARTAG